MGWFWQSTSQPAPPASSQTQAPPVQTSPPKPASAITESVDQEVAKFWQMLQEESNPDKPVTPVAAKPVAPPPAPKPSSWLSWRSASTTAPTTLAPPPEQPSTPADPHARSPESLAMSEEQYPTTMSCRDAFDYAWHCATPGGQITAVYRYGSIRTCSDLWDDFWFCMRTKSYPPNAKAEAIKEHYRAKEASQYGGGKPSSEDIWESRPEKVPPGTAFKEKFNDPMTSDADFQKAELERRRIVREHVGYDKK